MEFENAPRETCDEMPLEHDCQLEEYETKVHEPCLILLHDRLPMMFIERMRVNLNPLAGVLLFAECFLYFLVSRHWATPKSN